MFDFFKKDARENVLTLCRKLCAPESTSLFLYQSLQDLNSQKRTQFIELLVSCLNTELTHIVHLDLCWNELKRENIGALKNLKHVHTLDLRENDINGENLEDMVVLSNFNKNISQVYYYNNKSVDNAN